MMVNGLAGEVTAEELAAVPENPTSMGVVLRKGRRERLNTQRMGDPLQWQTASLSASEQVWGERVPLVHLCLMFLRNENLLLRLAASVSRSIACLWVFHLPSV